MISVSQEVIDLINADSRTFRAKFKHGDSVYDKIMSLKWNVCLPSSSFSVGNALSIGIQCTAFDVPVSIKGEELELVITIEGSADEISIGSFTAEKPTIQNGIVSFNAYDDMSRAGNIPYNSTLGEGKHTVNQYVADVAETLGIGYISLGSEGEVTVENDYLSGNSCRNALAYLAGYLGRNCVIKNKKISMKKFTLVDYTMNADRIEEPELEDIDSEIDFIIAQISSNNTIMNGNGATGTELVCPIMTESQLSNVANMLFGDASLVKTYRSGKVKLLLGDPRLELCDVIKLDYKDTEYIIPITSISFEYDGGLMTDLEAYALKEPTLLTPSQRLDFAVQEEVKKVLEQLKNIDGIYFYIRYSPNADGSNMTEEPDDKTEYIGVCSTNQSSAPGEASAYTWSKFKGTDGSSNFFHVKYSNDGGKTFTGTNGETAGEYIGILVDSNEDDSTNPSDYTWSKIVGKDGKGISGVINYYLTTNKADGVTRYDFGGNTEIVTPDKDKPYLWNYEEIRYTSGNSTYTDPCIIGNFAENGSNGRGIKSITEYYLTTKDSSTPQKSSFKDTVQTPTPDLPFLWNYEKIIYTDGSTPYESEVRIIGVYGEEGRGVSKVETEYRLSTSDTSLSSGYTWGTDAPAWQDGLFLWTRLVTYYTDGTNTPSDPVVDASWKKTSVVDAASKELNETLANALGLHVTEYPVGTSKIRYYHSNPSLTDSKSGDTILVFNAKGFGVCTTGWNGGNPVFQNGAEFEKGKAVWNILAANKISADLIEAGSIKSLPSAKVQTMINLEDGTISSTDGETSVKIQGGYTDDNGVTYPAGIALESEIEDRHFMLTPSEFSFTTIEYLLALFLYELNPSRNPKPEDPYFSSVKEKDIKTTNLHCKNIYLLDVDSDEEFNLFDALSMMSEQVNLLSESLTALQEKYLALEEALGQQHEHTASTAVRENVVNATCTSQGSYDEVVYCSSCGEKLSITKKYTSAHGHSYVAVVTPPTETSGGYTTHTCSRCGDKYVDNYTNATGCIHDYELIEVAPTCTEQGYNEYTCTKCHYSYKDAYKDATGHNDGNNDGYCDKCGVQTGEFFTINVRSNNTNYGTVGGGGTFLSGSRTIISAEAKPGYKFVQWSDGSTAASRFITVTGEKTYTAYFEASEQTLALNTTTTVNVAASTVEGKFEQNVPLSDFTFIKFVAPSSGTYTFECTGRTLISTTSSTDTDPTARLYDSTKTNKIAEDDDSAGNSNFKIEKQLEAGTYYLAVKFYRVGITGTMNIKVSSNSSSGGGSTETKQITFTPGYGDYRIVRNGTETYYVNGATDVRKTLTFNIGDEIELEHTSNNSKYVFAGWYDNDYENLLSSDNPYSFTVSSSTPNGINNTCKYA